MKAGATRGLLGRLTGEGGASEEDAILEHLRAVLNTRRGESRSCPSLGLVDFSDVAHHFPARAFELADDIQRMLEKYESRLTNITVSPRPSRDPLRIVFEIAAVRRRDSQRFQIRTELSADGGFEVAK